VSKARAVTYEGRAEMSMRANERVAWFNGAFMPECEVRIPFRDLSWVYGDGCFDMTRSFGHRLFKVGEQQLPTPMTGVRL